MTSLEQLLNQDQNRLKSKSFASLIRSISAIMDFENKICDIFWSLVRIFLCVSNFKSFISANQNWVYILSAFQIAISR